MTYIVFDGRGYETWLAESNDLIEFAYAYPREAATIPGLAAWLDNDRATRRDALIAAAGGAVLIGEAVGWRFALAAVLVLGGVAWASWPRAVSRGDG